jgi:predicted DNA-binding protein (UPF0251 family)
MTKWHIITSGIEVRIMMIWDHTTMAFSDVLIIDAIKALNNGDMPLLNYEQIAQKSGVSWRTVARAVKRQKGKKLMVIARTRYGCKYEVIA